MNKFIFALLFTIMSACAPAFAAVKVHTLLASATTTAAPAAKYYGTFPKGLKTFHATGLTSSGAGACVATIYGSSAGTANTWVVLGTITLTLSATTAADGFASAASWKYTMAKLASVSGTDAACSVYADYEE